jgi:hypothetical protein
MLTNEKLILCLACIMLSTGATEFWEKSVKTSFYWSQYPTCSSEIQENKSVPDEKLSGRRNTFGDDAERIQQAIVQKQRASINSFNKHVGITRRTVYWSSAI